MISDNLKDDEILDDDFDIDDDFEDDWDDQGDDIQSGEAENAVAASSSGKKSFLQKFFLPIVIGIAVIFGGIFAAGQGLFSSAPEAEKILYNEENAAVTDAVEPITSVDDLLGDTDTSNPVSDNAAVQDTPLTPLPGDTSNTQIELADLEAELQDDNILLEETLNFVSGDDNATAQQENNMFPDITAEVLIDTSNDSDISTQAIAGDSLPEEESFNPAVDLVAAEEVQNDVTLIVEDTPLVSDDTAVSLTTSDDTAADALETLKDENMLLTQSNEALEETVAALGSEIEALKLKIEMMAAPVATPTTKTAEPMPTPKPVSTPETNTPKAMPNATTKPAAAPMKWILRSAQPNKATIAIEGSNDLRTIEVGNVVKGLGRIQSISLENGAWVVRGSQGNISQ